MSQQPPPQQPNQYQMQPVVPGNGLGIASMVLGIIALCLFCVPILPWLLGVVAIVLGIISIVQASGAPTGKAKVGLVLAFIAIMAGVGFWGLIGYGANKAGNQIQQKLDEAQKDNPQWQQQLKDAGDKFNDAMKKAQEQADKAKEQADKAKDLSTPAQPTQQPPAVMLMHPAGVSIYNA